MKQKIAVPAETNWRDIPAEDFPGSPFVRIGKKWMLITAGDISTDKGNWNTMTASWGGLGVLWGVNTAFIFVRPTRFTFDFLNKAPFFTLSFFEDAYKNALDLCGKKSGVDTDKAEESGLTPVYFKEEKIKGVIGFKEAREIIVCRKLFAQDIDPKKFVDASIEKHYPDRDYHRMYIGEITGIKSR